MGRFVSGRFKMGISYRIRPERRTRMPTGLSCIGSSGWLLPQTDDGSQRGCARENLMPTSRRKTPTSHKSGSVISMRMGRSHSPRFRRGEPRASWETASRPCRCPRTDSACWQRWSSLRSRRYFANGTLRQETRPSRRMCAPRQPDLASSRRSIFQAMRTMWPC